jgi:deoxyhypusine synthase
LLSFQLESREESYEEDLSETDLFIRRKSGCTIFLGYTSNMISSGVRDTIRFLVQHKMVFKLMFFIRISK